MLKSRTSLPWVLLASAAICVSGVDGCESSADPPDNTGFGPGGSAGATPDGSGGTSADGGGGSSASGATGGTGGTLNVESGVVDKKCKDPSHPVDTDGDMIADDIEGEDDPDKDGKVNSADDDSDGDNVLDAIEAGVGRADPCTTTSDTDLDGTPDFLDPDSDSDGQLDKDEPTCPTPFPHPVADCRLIADCDEDGVVDIVDTAAGGGTTADCDGFPPAKAGLYFVVPYNKGEQKKRFSFSTGIKDADIYFMIDTTASMQAAIDNIKTSLDTTIIPKILNGDSTANPKIPPIPNAYIGIGDFKDVPWLPYGQPGDDIYRWRYDIPGVGHVVGGVAPPLSQGGTLLAPLSVKQILSYLTAGGGGDGPEAATQALWLAVTNLDYRVVGGGEPWPPNNPPGSGIFNAADWRQECEPNRVGRGCFRPGRLPVFAIITDADMHNGPNGGTGGVDYIPPSSGNVSGTKPYSTVVDALNAVSAKIVGVSVNTGVSGVAHYALTDLANKTNSTYQAPGAAAKPLVTSKDTETGSVSDELVRLIGLLAGQGLHNVTTVTTSYSCAGNVDCDGDNLPDPAYTNPSINPPTPIDATSLIMSVEPVPSTATPTPYVSISPKWGLVTPKFGTFFGIRGDATVEFEVTANNTTINPPNVLVVEALLRVQTPAGQALGGTDGVKRIYLVIPGRTGPN